jgi:hypothetical protein
MRNKTFSSSTEKYWRKIRRFVFEKFVKTCRELDDSLLHDLIFTGESRKSCLYKKPEVDPELAFDAIER